MGDGGGMEERLLQADEEDHLESHGAHGEHGHDEAPSKRLQFGVVLIVIAVILTTAGSTFLLSQLRARSDVDELVVMVGSTDESYKHIGVEFCLHAMEAVHDRHEVVFKRVFLPPEPLYTGFKDRHNASGNEVDVIIGAEMPINHAEWLDAEEKAYRLLGTLSENVQVSWVVPDYLNIESLADYAQYIKSTPEAGRVYYDRECVPCALAFVTTKHKLFPDGAPDSLKLLPSTSAEIAESLNKKEQFTALWTEASYMPLGFPSLKPFIDSTNYSAYTQRNVNKVIIHKETYYALQSQFPKAIEVLSACFLGNQALSEMDAQVRLKGKTVKVAVEEWIHENQEYYDSMLRNVDDDESGGGGHH